MSESECQAGNGHVTMRSDRKILPSCYQPTLLSFNLIDPFHSLKAFKTLDIVSSFASLPNELKSNILALVQPEDLENFAQISRKVYYLASSFLT